MQHQPGSSARPDWPVAVVIGGGGLGMAVARRLGLSHRLLIADRDDGHLNRQVGAFEAAGYDVTGCCCDVTVRGDLEGLAAAASARGPLRSLAYVVGLSPSLGNFRQIMEVNLVGVANAVDVFSDRMMMGGAALCISSSSAHMQAASPDLAEMLDDPLGAGFLDNIAGALHDRADAANAYMLSKKGVIRLCQRRAREWGQRGVRILSLSPGLIATPQGAGEYKASPGKRKLFEATPLGREATMLEIADVADFLLSDRASYITGTDLLVDGGLIAALGMRPFA